MQSTLGWLVPFHGASRIISLNETFEQKMNANRHDVASNLVKTYVPWLFFNESKPLPPALFDPAQVCNRLVVQNEYLTILAQFLREGECEFGVFGLSNSGMNVFTNIACKEPNAEVFFEEAKDLLFSAVPEFQKLFLNIVKLIIPLEIKDKENSPIAGFSSHLCQGAIFLSTPVIDRKYWRAELAIDLAHELAHQVLNLFQRTDNLLLSDLYMPIYSGVRRINRPAIMALHGAAALSYILLSAKSIEQCSQANSEEVEYARQLLNGVREDLLKTLSSLESSCQFSTVGNLIMSDLKTIARLV